MVLKYILFFILHILSCRREEAMKRELVINPAWCKACGICVAFCPKNALVLTQGTVTLNREQSCILCGICELRCPDYAIYIKSE
ncbi:ferredoxin family protein [Enterocloster lavalensis]|uniref:ferredoxin family protein n=2 Tax=Enterocloster lavalensis TaxID=460384 RepID=UPI0034A2BF8C